MSKKESPPGTIGGILARIFLSIVKTVFAIYVGLLAGVYFCQRYLEYLPISDYAGTPKENGVAEMSIVTVKTPDNLSLIGWFGGPKHTDGKVVVVFHGNGSNLGPKASKARYFLDKGYGVFLCEYRGFGGNPGSPTEEGVYNDARAVVRWLEEQGFPKSSIVLYGESLGTGIAVQMATEFEPFAVILEAPYSSAVSVAERRYPIFPVRLLMKDHFDSISKINKFDLPLLIVHGDRDHIIPISFSRDLFNAANEPKKFMQIDGAGHLDLYNFGAGKLIVDWLDAQVEGEKK
ncbi:MAG: alpha/beta hydrolase [Alphaproteobacteria bacterium]